MDATASPLSMPEQFEQLLTPISIITVTMFAWWVWNYAVYRANKKLSEQGIQVQAVITEIERYKMWLGIKFHLEDPKMRYRFLTREGAEIISGKKEIPYLMRAREEQDIIPVYYLAERPNVNHMMETLKMDLRGHYFWLFVPLVGWLLLVTPLLASTLLGG